MKTIKDMTDSQLQVMRRQYERRVERLKSGYYPWRGQQAYQDQLDAQQVIETEITRRTV